jgi:transitional endoplasmic reticulum ATPase
MDAPWKEPMHYIFPLPRLQKRLDILAVYSKDMDLASDIKLPELANLTHGLVGAELEALCFKAKH